MSDLSFRAAYEGGYDLGGEPFRAEIREGFGTHQIAILDYPVMENTFKDYPPENTPMAFRWSVSPTDVRTFYGYVNHYEYTDTDNPDQMRMRIYGVGTSRPLNTPEPDSWANVTASYIARLMAEKYGLRAVVHRSKEILPYWSPGKDSDFVMLTKLAKKSGFQFWVDGATLYFVDPQILLTSPARSVATEYVLDREPNDTLTEVQAVSGSMAPVPGAPTVQRVFGIDDSTGNLIEANSRKQLNDLGLDVPGQSSIYAGSVGSLAEATHLNEISVVNGSWASIRAIVFGDARARTGSLVNLEGNALHQKYQGTWLAGSLIHVIDQNASSGLFQYTAQLDLIRNQQSKVYFSTTQTLKDALAEVPAVLRGGKKWESSIMEAVYV